MDIRGNHLSGLLLLKKMEDSITGETVYRFFFSNEFGMTYFDLGLYPDSLQVFYCFEPMNKKGLLSLLETTFRLLTVTNPSIERNRWYIEKNGQRFVARSKEEDLLFWTIYDKDLKQIQGRNGKTGFIDKIILSVEQEEESGKRTFQIHNPVIGLTLSLRRLN